VAEVELELHARLCGGIVVVSGSKAELSTWTQRLRGVAPVYTPYTLRELKELPALTLVGTIEAKQLIHLFKRSHRENAECTIIDVRRSIYG